MSKNSKKDSCCFPFKIQANLDNYFNEDTYFWEGLIGFKWRNKLFMPESVTRYYIKITEVRAERLQNITERNYIKESITNFGKTYYYINGYDGKPHCSSRDAYAALIDKINGKETWESNPYVWVYDYELTNKEETL